MEKRVKIYSLLIFITYCLMLINGIDRESEDFKRGYRRSMQSAAIINGGNLGFESSSIRATPIDDSGLTTNNKQGALISIPSDEFHPTQAIKNLLIARDISVMCTLPIMLYFPFLFFQIVRAIWQNNILNRKLVRRVKRMGWLLIGSYLYLLLVFMLVDYFIASQQDILKNCNLSIIFTDYEILILGFATLIFGEILSHTLKMKEEQELTI